MREWKQANRHIRLILNELIVSCPNKMRYNHCPFTCDRVLKLEHMLQHVVKDCPFRTIRCSGFRMCNYEGLARKVIPHEFGCKHAN
jgi:hypothetical protein